MLATKHRARLTMERNASENERNVRRQLFTDENESEDERQNYDNLIMEDNLQQSERDKEKWNFDFKRGVPLPGRYQWIKLDEHGNEIPSSINSINEVQNTNEQEEQIEETERRRNDEPMDEARKRARLEES
ncbi:cyclin-dependent kinase inhibitor 1 isoform X2 [Camponotus floridanus]|uniref:cyclin-dependent kinase inhibitor 1 isoform X2 n=1 Tax=Camponotus floridanus TaxID=104421 RepID=UPI00059DA871|nr:cyclin-dependent kinase inhibitor 1 isoform X2 [Camponotus floridanus]